MTVPRFLTFAALAILTLHGADSVRAGAAAPATRPSHFQCYDVGRESLDQRAVSLVDDFGPSTVNVRRPKLLCAPVNKNNEDPTAPGDADHLVGYEIRRGDPRFEERSEVVVEDQFGTLVLDLRRPDRLLVPSAKGLTDPPSPLDPPLVDHYQCYAVRGDRRRVAGVSVEDQFGTGTTHIKKPLRLCLPVDKQGEGILDGAARLMCYRIKSGPRVNQTVFVDNQIAAGPLKVRRARELCVPTAAPTACCDPLTEPGQHQNPLCLEGHACCPDSGEWSCSIGDGKTFICGGQQTTGPFGSTCSP